MLNIVYTLDVVWCRFMKIVAIGDVHTDIENLIQFLDKVKTFTPTVIVFSGDFIDIGIELKGFTRVDVASLILEEMGALNAPILAVPGNHDKEVLPILEEYDVSIHGIGKVIDGVGFYGFGGAKTPFGTPIEPEEGEIESGLRKAYEDVKKAKIKVQVTHSPPYNTKLDIITSGTHVGSQAVRNTIEELKPNAAICGHIHEARGVDFIGNTKIVNVGRFPEGYCGLIDIDTANSIVSAKIVNLI